MRLSRATAVFGGMFALCFLVQWLNVSEQSFVDQGIWQPAAVTISHGHLLSPDDNAYGYPGTTFLLPAALAVRLGVDPWIALKSAVVILYSLAVAAAGAVMYALRPKMLWSLAGCILLIFQPVFIRETPPSALSTALIPLICLLTLYLHEHRDRRAQLPAVIFGLVCGIALATRLDIGAAVCAAAAALLFIERDKRVWLCTGVAFVAFVLLDPFMWWPLQYALGMYAKIHEHFFDKYARPSLFLLIGGFSIAVLSFLFSTLLVFAAPTLAPVSRGFLLWLAATTAAIIGILLLSNYHPIWYFYPLALVWEVFGPLFVAAPFDERLLPARSLFGKPLARTCALFALPLLQVVLFFTVPWFF